MPVWIHSRAEHLLAKNPKMTKSQAFAIATQQSHATGKTPKGYGTSAGKREAKAKFDKPKKAYMKTPNPGSLETPKLDREPKTRWTGKRLVKKSSVEVMADELAKLAGTWGGATVTPTRYQSSIEESDPVMARQQAKSWQQYKPKIEDMGKDSRGRQWTRVSIDIPRNRAMKNEEFALDIEEDDMMKGFKAAAALHKQLHRPKLRSKDSMPPSTRFDVKTASIPQDVLGRGLEVGLYKKAFTQSQYGPTGGTKSMRHASVIPGFVSPPVKTGGPPSEKKEKKAAVPTTPAGRLASKQQVGKPRVGTPPGPSISQLSKPIGFGRPKPGMIKGSI